MRVLVVDDEEDLADAVRTALRRAAIAADVAYDGDTALAQLAVNDYDAVVLDLDPFRVEVLRAGRRVPVTRKEFAVLHVLMSARGGTVSAEQLLEKAWDENADPFTNAIRVTISSLRKKLGEPPVIHT